VLSVVKNTVSGEKYGGGGRCGDEKGDGEKMISANSMHFVSAKVVLRRPGRCTRQGGAFQQARCTLY
jgi:hypothetical protein